MALHGLQQKADPRTQLVDVLLCCLCRRDQRLFEAVEAVVGVYLPFGQLLQHSFDAVKTVFDLLNSVGLIRLPSHISPFDCGIV